MSEMRDVAHVFVVVSHIYRDHCFFFFNDTATTEIYTLSLHDALPISHRPGRLHPTGRGAQARGARGPAAGARAHARSEEHTSELQSQSNLVCRLLLEKKKKTRSGRWTVMTVRLSNVILVPASTIPHSS